MIVTSPLENPPSKIVLGSRFPPHRVLRVADSNPVNMHDMLPSDGRIKIVVFPGVVASTADLKELQVFSTQLEYVLIKFPKEAFGVITVLKTIGDNFSYMDIPVILRSHWKR